MGIDRLKCPSGVEFTIADAGGKNTQKKLTAITKNLERLEWFGLVICEEHNDIPHWYHTETIAAA